MENLSQIAQDYLDSYEILRDARKKLEKELKAWWRILIKDYLTPTVSSLADYKETWDVANSPGKADIFSTRKTSLGVRVSDPRQSGSGSYYVQIFGNKPVLNKLKKNSSILAALKNHQDELGVEELFPRDYCMMGVPVDIKGDNPEATMEAIASKVKGMYAAMLAVEALM